MKDCIGTSKRYYLASSIKAHIETLDDLELAIVLTWLKTGGLYQYGTKMLAAIDPDKIADQAKEIAENSKAIEAAKIAEEEAKKDAERAKHKTRELWQTPMAAATK